MSQTISHYWSTSRTLDGKKYDAKLTPEDVKEMQTIDADCNDCLHFKRGAMRKAPGLTIFDGHCLRFDKPTKAFPMQYSGNECFQHRKSQ